MVGNRKRGVAGTSSGSRDTQQLNDGRRRVSWKAPETEEEWRNFGRTRADHPITEEEEQEYSAAWRQYRITHNGDTPTIYSDRFIVSRDQEPPASQLMPAKLKASCLEADEEIERLAQEWVDTRKAHVELEAQLEEKKRRKKALTREIVKDESEINIMKQRYTELEEAINKKHGWIVSCRHLYPH